VTEAAGTALPAAAVVAAFQIRTERLTAGTVKTHFSRIAATVFARVAGLVSVARAVPTGGTVWVFYTGRAQVAVAKGVLPVTPVFAEVVLHY